MGRVAKDVPERFADYLGLDLVLERQISQDAGQQALWQVHETSA